MNQEVINELAAVLQKTHSFVTARQLDIAVAEIVRKTAERVHSHPNAVSLCTVIRAMKAREGRPINPQTAEADVHYAKALTTGSTPGSYLVPTIQSQDVVAMLAQASVARASGCRIWPMAGIQKLDIGTLLASPTFLWTAQNSQQTPTDPNYGQVAFDLKECRAIIAVPNRLLATAQPAFDVVLSELMAQGAAGAEDAAIFASSTVSGGPKAVMSVASISTVLVAGSANGGNLGFSDILAVLEKAAVVKAKGPFVWFMSPRTYYQRILGLTDTTSRPLVIPSVQGLIGPTGGQVGVMPSGTLMGYPVYVTASIAEDEAYGSGTAQSHVIFTNPSYLHLAQDTNLEISISTDRYFDSNQTGIRATMQRDFDAAPPAGVIVLEGIN
jgi:HK97 family phage major capsid protein